MYKKFEYYKNEYSRWAFNISSTGSEDVGKYSTLNIALGKHSWWFKLPPIIKPKSKWIDLSKDAWAKGSKGYMDHIRREYGFSIIDDNIQLHYGIQPGSWSRDDPKNSDHTKLIWIPWRQTRRVRYDFYYPNQSYYDSVDEDPEGPTNFDSIEKLRKGVRKIKFKFKDFDGEPNVATCHITEMEWRYGTGWFKWVGWIRKPIIRRRLEIEFEKETGRQKGSWKGGTIGTSEDMTAHETPLTAFTRYGCGDERQKYHGIVNRGFTDIEVVYEPEKQA